MAAPWEKYKAKSPNSKPWENYSTQQVTVQDKSNLTPEESSIKDKILTGLDYGARALDYLGGFSRTSLADLISEVSGDPNFITSEQYNMALKGKAPSSSELLEKAGVSEGGKLSDVLPEWAYSETGEGLPLKRGGFLDPSARGTAGFALDMATDPLTYLTFGASGVAKKPVKEGLEALSKSQYKKALEPLQDVAEEFGKSGAPEVYRKYGMYGSAKSIKDQSKKVIGKLDNERKKIIDILTESGEKINETEATRYARDKIFKDLQSKDPGLVDDALKAKETVKKYRSLNLEGVTPDKAQQYKTTLYKGVNESGWKKEGIKGSYEKEIDKLIAKGHKEQLEKVAKNVDEDLYNKLKEINSDEGILLTTRKPLKKLANAESKRNNITSVDILTGIMTQGLTGNPFYTAGALGAKKAHDIYKSVGGKTTIGKAAKELSKVQGLDEVSRRALIDLLSQDMPKNYVEKQE